MLADDRPLYPIGTAARMLGIAPATLRTWEQRYGQVVPSRDDGGRRLYSRADLARLRLVRERIEEGLTPARAHQLLEEWQDLPPETAASGDEGLFGWLSSRPELLDRWSAGILEPVVEAAGALCAFLEVNFEHPEFGLCSSLVRRAFGPGQDSIPAGMQFAALPWSKFPEHRDRLARGEAVSYLIEDLEGEARRVYERSPVRAEVNVPLTVHGEWVGLVGMTRTDEGEWSEEDLEVLRVAAGVVQAETEHRRAEERFRALVS